MKNWKRFFQLLTILILCIGLLFLGIWIDTILPCNIKTAFLTCYASLIGGLCTLAGVLITLKWDAYFSNKSKIEQNKPELYLPFKYDQAKANQLKFQFANEPNNTIANMHIYIKNSEKISCIINGITANNIEFKPSSPVFIERGELFCISIFLKERCKLFSLEVKSSDERIYVCNIDLNDKKLIISEKNNASHKA